MAYEDDFALVYSAGFVLAAGPHHAVSLSFDLADPSAIQVVGIHHRGCF